MIVDLYIVYKILRRLTSPFNKWKAYDKGIIDAKGTILLDKKARQAKGVDSDFTKLDLLTLRLKHLISRVPGVNRRIATMAAALWMIKEDYDIDEEMLTEENLLERMEVLTEEDGGGIPPTNNTMNVAGADGTEPGVSKKAQRQIVRRVRNRKRKKDE